MPPSCFTWQNAGSSTNKPLSKISSNFRGRTDLMGRIMESSKEPWWTSARKKYVMVFSSIAWYGDTVNNHEQPNILKNVVNKKQDIQFSISCHSWHIHCFDAGQPGSCGWTRQCLLLHDHLYPTNWTKHEDLHLWQTQMTWGPWMNPHVVGLLRKGTAVWNLELLTCTSEVWKTQVTIIVKVLGASKLIQDIHT